MNRLVRITSNDYREFRRAYSKIEYSFWKKGEENRHLSKIIRETIQFAIKNKSEFLKDVEDPNKELYFFTVDGEIQGIVELIFSKGTCNIYQFAVFHHGKGWGSVLFQETLRVIKEHKVNKITLWCPYEGAQIFWRKQGFYPKTNSCNFEKRI